MWFIPSFVFSLCSIESILVQDSPVSHLDDVQCGLLTDLPCSKLFPPQSTQSTCHVLSCQRIHSTCFKGFYCSRVLGYTPSQDLGWIILQNWSGKGAVPSPEPAQLHYDREAASEATPPPKWVPQALPVFPHFMSLVRGCHSNWQNF